MFVSSTYQKYFSEEPPTQLQQNFRVKTAEGMATVVRGGAVSEGHEDDRETTSTSGILDRSVHIIY